LLPEYLVKRSDDGWTLRNYEGRLFRYPDPLAQDSYEPTRRTAAAS
jgi:hypothetical protein